jgi:oligoribonuclease NrnB/cAMP/cGMP phosphodiesterase (DHH superfamily)
MKTYIIYHQVKPGIDCPDGIAAAWVAKQLYPESEIKGWTYQSESLPAVNSGDRLIVVDFSFPADVIEQWIRDGVKAEVIDHHKTAEEALNRFYVEDFQDALNAEAHDEWNVVFDMKECGATLTWKYFFPGKPMPVFLEYVRDRDLWNFDLDGTEEVHEAMARIGRTFDLFDELAQMNREQLLACLKPIGRVLLKPKRQAIARAVSRIQWGEVAGYPTIAHVILNQDGSEDRLVSDICSKLYKAFPESLFVACLTSDKTWSLRSNAKGNNTDVGAIAAFLGGGGHRNAAGFAPNKKQEVTA